MEDNKEIDIKDLRVGDLVKWRLNIFKIDEISDEGAAFITDYVGRSLDAPLREIEPIEITEDILLNNGWKRLDVCPEDFTKSHIVREANGDIYLMGGGKITVKPIKYVHQLQNLLWALGMDDKMTIKTE